MSPLSILNDAPLYCPGLRIVIRASYYTRIPLLHSYKTTVSLWSSGKGESNKPLLDHQVRVRFPPLTTVFSVLKMSKKFVRGQEILDESPSKKARVSFVETHSTGTCLWPMTQERMAQLECRMTHTPLSGACKHCAIIIE